FRALIAVRTKIPLLRKHWPDRTDFGLEAVDGLEESGRLLMPDTVEETRVLVVPCLQFGERLVHDQASQCLIFQAPLGWNECRPAVLANLKGGWQRVGCFAHFRSLLPHSADCASCISKVYRREPGGKAKIGSGYLRPDTASADSAAPSAVRR